MASAAGRSVSRSLAAAADATRHGRRRFYYDRAPPSMLLRMLLYSQFGD